jgi:hypothetical protein
MAQQNNKYIKYILISIAFILFGCEKVNTNRKNSGFVISQYINPLQLVEIDSCEYFFGEWGYASVLTHKGNCKFCEQRKPKLK